MIANLITITNLCLGLYVIQYSNSISLLYCSHCILLGSLLDCLDGPVARITGTTSRLGKFLDHIADFTTFGVAPVTVINTYTREKYPDQFTLCCWIIGNLYREFSSQTRLANGDYLGCPSPFVAGLWAYGNIITTLYFPEFIETWCVCSTNFLVYLMIDNRHYIHDRLIELDPLRSKQGFINFIVILSIISTLIVQPVETLGLSLPGIWTHTWGGYCLGYIIFGPY